MRATDPRPELAAMPAESLAPAAAALAGACAEDISAGPPPLFLLAPGGKPPPFFSPPARREGLGAGLSARRGVAGLHGRWPPPGLPRKRGRRKEEASPRAGRRSARGQLHARNGYSI